jgi:hypothetical protein
MFYGMSLNMTRQTMAQAFCILSFSYLLNRKFLKSFIIFLPALGFHITAFIYLAVYPIFYFINKARSVRTIRIYETIGGLTVIIVLFFLNNFIGFFVSSGLLGDKFLSYTSDDRWGSSIPVAFLTYCIVFFILFRYATKKERHKINYYFFFECISLICIILCFSGIVSTYAVRGMVYFSFLYIVILPILLFNFQKIRILYKRIFPFILCFLLFYWYMTIIVENLSETYPYTSKILRIY